MRALVLLAAVACGAPAAKPPRQAPYYAGDETGLREVGADGKTLRTLSTTPTLTWRALPSGDLVFVVKNEMLDPLEVRLVGRDGSGERVLLSLERTIICGAEVDYLLGLVSNEDLWITRDGGICLTLRDDVPKAAELEHVTRIDPATGGHHSVFLHAPPGCPEVSPRDPCR